MGLAPRVLSKSATALDNDSNAHNCVIPSQSLAHFVKPLSWRVVQVKRTEGEYFDRKEQGEQHRLELHKEWVDTQMPEFNSRVG
jgi:hypothetical protein